MNKQIRTRPARLVAVMGSAVLLAACASAPTGPSMMVLPGTGKSFDQFRVDDAACRQYAVQQTAASGSAQAANDRAVESAVIGTAVGAIAGAAIGGNRQGAAVGAGTGLIVGSAMGGNAAYASSYEAQRRYDHAYIQCMYAAGHKVPVSGGIQSSRGYTSSQPTAPAPPPAPSVVPPPPPPGAPPPPPPGVIR